MPIFRSSVVAGALFLTIALAGSAALADRSVDRTFAPAGISQVVVHVDSGDVRFVAASDESAVHLHVALRGTIPDPQIQSVRDGKQLTITIESPHGAVLPFGSRGSVEYEIAYPSSTALQVYDESGDLSVDGSRAAVAMETGSGNIDLTNAHGPVDVLADSGDIRVDLASDWHASSVRMQTGTGDLHLRTPANFYAHFVVKSDTGKVDNALTHSSASGPFVFLYTRAGNISIAHL